MIKEPVHSSWVPEGAIGGVREILDEEQSIRITHYFHMILEPIGLDTGHNNKENVPPEHLN